MKRIVLFPGNQGMDCQGNGLNFGENGEQVECCCDECNYLSCCNDEKYFEYNKLGFRNITKKGEEALIDYYNGCVWITNFDIKAVPFYQSTNTDKRYANNADLLIGIGETVGAGERYRTGKEVREALKLHQVSEDEYKWYIEMKDKYPMKTSGFGMGIERFILWLTKKDDIRDCQILPRFLGKDIIP